MTTALEQNPAQLFPEDILNQKSPGQWRIARTKSRREKALAEFLASHEVGYYLPMVKTRQRDRKRVRYSLIPIFSGYIFFKSSDLQRYQAFKSNHISRIIDVKDEDQLLSDLQKVQKAISLNAPLYPYDFVRQGDMVVIKKGPFKGLQGVIQRKNSHCRLVLNVNYLLQAVALDIEAHMVEPMGKVRLVEN